KVIVTLQHQDSRRTETRHSGNSGALTLPLVVLVDGDTASAAEMLAGALKENKRARLVGQTTFGKGCSQDVVRLPQQGLLGAQAHPTGPMTGAIRITVARFISPDGNPYTGRGVLPHVFAERPPEAMSDDDPQLTVARAEAQRLLDVLR